MSFIKSKELELLKKQYPSGSRVVLIGMDDPYRGPLNPGELGTIVTVDSIGTIHVNWDCGSSLGIVYGVDKCKLVDIDCNKRKD